MTNCQYEYRIIQAGSADFLEQKVAEFLDEGTGWQPCGGVALHANPTTKDVIWTQAIMREIH